MEQDCPQGYELLNISTCSCAQNFLSVLDYKNEVQCMSVVLWNSISIVKHKWHHNKTENWMIENSDLVKNNILSLFTFNWSAYFLTVILGSFRVHYKVVRCILAVLEKWRFFKRLNVSVEPGRIHCKLHTLYRKKKMIQFENFRKVNTFSVSLSGGYIITPEDGGKWLYLERHRLIQPTNWNETSENEWISGSFT